MDFFEKLIFIIKESKTSMLTHGFPKSERTECAGYIKELKQENIQKAEEKLNRMQKPRVKEFCEKIKNSCLSYNETKRFK